LAQQKFSQLGVARLGAGGVNAQLPAATKASRWPYLQAGKSYGQRLGIRKPLGGPQGIATATNAKAVLARLAATALAACLQHGRHIAPIGDPIAQIKLGHLLQQLGFSQQSSSRQALPHRLNDQGKALHPLLNAH
jgi:hypothetical protein